LAVASVLQFSSGQALAQEKNYKIAVVVHGGEADPFWKPVERGVKDASDLYPDLEVTYTGTTVFSVEEFMTNLETAIASKPDALVCTLAIPEVMDETLRKVIDAGLPVVAINAPDLREPASERIPVLTYIGEDSYFIGVTAAQETLKRVTPKRAVFCNHHTEAANMNARGQGWVDTLTEQGITAESFPVAEPVNAVQAAEDVAAYLKEHPETDVLFISNTAITEAVIERLLADGVDVGNSIKIAQMDVSPAILEYIQDGLVMFTMDQQPYLQGYLGVVTAYLNVKYALTPPPAPLSTGPAVVTATDINPAKGY
jgi:simple sugar transport system substrate-binding protein